MAPGSELMLPTPKTPTLEDENPSTPVAFVATPSTPPSAPLVEVPWTPQPSLVVVPVTPLLNRPSFAMSSPRTAELTPPPGALVTPTRALVLFDVLTTALPFDSACIAGPAKPLKFCAYSAACDPPKFSATTPAPF